MEPDAVCMKASALMYRHCVNWEDLGMGMALMLFQASLLEFFFFSFFLSLSLWSQLINIPGQHHITGGKIQLIEYEIFITLLYVSIRERSLIDLLISMDW